MSCHVDHIISATKNKVIPIAVANTPVKGRIHLLRKIRPIGVDETLIVAIHGLHAPRRQRSFDNHHALLVIATDFTGTLIHDVHLVAV